MPVQMGYFVPVQMGYLCAGPDGLLVYGPRWVTCVPVQMGYFVPVQMGYLCTGQEGLHVFNSGLNGSIVFQSRAHDMFEQQIAPSVWTVRPAQAR